MEREKAMEDVKRKMEENDEKKYECGENEGNIQITPLWAMATLNKKFNNSLQLANFAY